MISSEELQIAREEILNIARELHGINLDGYRPAFIERRLGIIASNAALNSTFHLKNELINNNSFANSFEMNISVNVTSMFRDPIFFKRLIDIIKEIFPLNEELRIWHPACSKGNEVFSLAILLGEIGLLSKSILYGTDICHKSLAEAKTGMINSEDLKRFSINYQLAGGKTSLNEYFNSSYGKALINKTVRAHTCFSHHKLGSDPIIRKFNIILCRNLFIYFNPKHQTMLLQNLINSLEDKGLLCMGLHEPIHHLEGAEQLECIDSINKIYRKKSTCKI